MRLDTGNVSPNTGPGRPGTSRLMLYLLLSVILMAMDQSGRFIPRIRAMLEYAVEPVYDVAEWPARALRGLRSYTRNYSRLVEENRQHEQDLLARAGELQTLAALEAENRRLRNLLRATEGRDYEFRFAELVSVSLDPYSHQVVIDRGVADGVFAGQAVIDGQGVMGQVESVQRHHARVRLISDPEHAIPVQILRTGQRTVAYGTGDSGRLSLPDLPTQSDVRTQDMLITSGLGDRFPTGFPVAAVTSIDRDTGGAFAAVDARPLASLDRGREVLLVLPADDGAETVDP